MCKRLTGRISSPAGCLRKKCTSFAWLLAAGSAACVTWRHPVAMYQPQRASRSRPASAAWSVVRLGKSAPSGFCFLSISTAEPLQTDVATIEARGSANYARLWLSTNAEAGSKVEIAATTVGGHNGWLGLPRC